jgi:3-deoxy-7-phosphoheptulonate synthase
MGVPVGCELLDTISPQFISDLVSWGAIGMFTHMLVILKSLIPSQVLALLSHSYTESLRPEFLSRLASRMELMVACQVWFNDFCHVWYRYSRPLTVVAVDAMRASSHPHAFMGVTEQGLAAIVKTKGI